MKQLINALFIVLFVFFLFSAAFPHTRVEPNYRNVRGLLLSLASYWEEGLIGKESKISKMPNYNGGEGGMKLCTGPTLRGQGMGSLVNTTSTQAR